MTQGYVFLLSDGLSTRILLGHECSVEKNNNKNTDFWDQIYLRNNARITSFLEIQFLLVYEGL